MTDATPDMAATAAQTGPDAARSARLHAGLKTRYARERRFKTYGILAVCIAVGFWCCCSAGW